MTFPVAARVGALAALAALTRPDGLIYVGAYPITALVLLRGEQLRRAAALAAVSIAAFAVPYGAYLAWRVTTFSKLVPNTAVAKAQGLPGLEGLTRPGELAGYLGWMAVAGFLVLLGAALAQPSPSRTGLLALLVPLGLAVAAYAILQHDWMEQYRFATPVWALGGLAGAVAAARVLPSLHLRGRIALVVTGCVAALATGLPLLEALRTFRAEPTVPLCAVGAATGAAPNAYADALGLRHAVLLAPDMGGAAMTSRLRLADLAGLADARIARFWESGDMRGLRDYVLDELRPELIKTHGGWSAATGLVEDPRMAAGYLQIEVVDPKSGLWVRRDLLGLGDEERLRALAASSVTPMWQRYVEDAPRASCGPRLQVGAARV